MRHVALSLAAVAALVLGGGRAKAGLITLAPAEDTYVRGGAFANNNYEGGDLLIKFDNTFDFARKSWLQFDTGSLAGLVEDATLQLTWKAGESFAFDVNIYGLNDGTAGELWDASAITWNNAPGNDPSSKNGVGADATLLGTVTIPAGAGAGDLVGLSGAALVNFLNADSNGHVTFIVTAATLGFSHGVTFSSSESLDFAPPQLQVNAVPEPASAVLWAALGLVGAAWRRRDGSRGRRERNRRGR